MSGKKRLISLMLVVVMLVSQFATMGASADSASHNVIENIYNSYDETYSSNSLYYTVLEDGTAEITGLYDYTNTLTIPSTIDGYTVTSIREYAFQYQSISQITLPNTLKHIGDDAFYGTTYFNNLRSESNGIVYIGNYLIYANGYWDDDESDQFLAIKNGTIAIADYAIDGYQWIHIPASVKYIGRSYSFDHIDYAGNAQNLTAIGYWDEYWDEEYDEYDEYLNSIYIDHYNATLTEKNKIIATCAQSGSVDVYSSCGKQVRVFTDRPDHSMGTKILTIAPSCENEGYGYSIYTCKNCGVYYKDAYVTSDNWKHTKGTKIKDVAPTCTEQGYTVYVCSVCSASFHDDYTTSNRYNQGKGHEKNTLIETIQPNCETNNGGYKVYSCKHCTGEYHEYFSNPTTKLHNYKLKEHVKQTCTEAGYNVYECTVCKYTVNKDYDYALGHKEGKLIKQQNISTCATPAYKEYNCLVCKKNYKDYYFTDTSADTVYPIHEFTSGKCKNCGTLQANVVESPHKYPKYMDKTWVISKKCDYMTITFSEYTRVENGSDFIYIYDKNDKEIGCYTGTELAGKSITVNGNIAKIKLTSDSSAEYYGFSTTSIVTVCNHTYNAGIVTTPAAPTKAGVKTFSCTKCGATKTASIPATGRINLKTKKAKVTVKAQAYTGKALKPSVTVKLGKKTLKKGTDYTVTYKNNKKIGKATVTIKGKGDYTGSVKATFKINPKKLSGLKVKAGKKQMTVSWKKASVTGYEIVYATSKNFKKGKKTVTVKSAKTVKKVIKKLKAKKTYYVKVRAYKTVKKVKYYSAFTSAKKVKIKK